MLLETDNQTLDDLRIFSKGAVPGIFDLYNSTHTRGGESLLKEMFLHPLSDVETIRRRASVLSYLADNKNLGSANGVSLAFPFAGAIFDTTEKYIRNRPEIGGTGQQELSDKDIENGVLAIIRLLQETRDFMNKDAIRLVPNFEETRYTMEAILGDPAFKPVFSSPAGGRLAYAAVAAFDRLFRAQEHEKIRELLSHIYLLDVYLSVANVAAERDFIFPEVYDKGAQILRMEGLYHPELRYPVANDIQMDGNTSMVFLTGANMAGKSTFLRSISTAVYLAHMGFPVAARNMAFSVMDGLYTTINLPDNLGIGASHFYAEVLRVKQIATELNRDKSLFVIFDELFRGTNVKDAHEATVAVTRAFSRRKSCRFIISSHIVEATENLQEEPGIDYLFLPTRLNGNVPEYTYTLQRGVTDDRHGMMIIRNEGILEILKNGRHHASTT